jgi:hypothetical protein
MPRIYTSKVFDRFSWNLLQGRYFHWNPMISVFGYPTVGNNLSVDGKSKILNMRHEFRSIKTKELTELQ